MQGIVIAGTHSGCGKTTITLGILSALKKKGFVIQSFKVGPDFIDTGLHKIITNRPSRNLDLWMCGEEYVKDCFYKHSEDVDIAVIEGVMGLYDGDFSTARLADTLNLPIILVIDTYGIAESAGAIVKGFMEYKTPSLIKGIIFNRVASERHFRRLRNSVCDIDVLGYLPRELIFEIPHRHLGLTVAEENPITNENLERLADTVLKHIDIDALINKIQPSHHQEKNENRPSPYTYPNKSSASVAIAYDKAFCFYYEDNIDLLRTAGAEIIKFSPLNDKTIPEADAIYIGGGYPELYAEELSKNTSMLETIYNWAQSEKPIYAECGGLMYLSKGIYDFDGNFFKMANVFPFYTQMKKGKSHLGYREIELNEDCILGKKGDKIRGHEFHYSEIKPSALSLQPSAMTTCYSLIDNSDQDIQKEGYRLKNVLSSYIHIHFGSNPAIAGNFIDFIKRV